MQRHRRAEALPRLPQLLLVQGLGDLLLGVRAVQERENLEKDKSLRYKLKTLSKIEIMLLKSIIYDNFIFSLIAFQASV